MIATTDLLTLPDLTTFYLITNLPAPGSSRARERPRRGQPGGSGAPLWLAHVGRTELQTGQARPRLVAVSSQERPGDPTPLATGVLCLLVLLVSCQSSAPSTSHEPVEVSDPKSVAPADVPAGAGTGKKNQRDKRVGRSSPGQRHCGRSGDGWSRGLCCGATGMAGRHCPHLLT